jgi:hypothetical protein
LSGDLEIAAITFAGFAWFASGPGRNIGAGSRYIHYLLKMIVAVILLFFGMYLGHGRKVTVEMWDG